MCEVVLPLARKYLLVKEPRIGMDHESNVLESLMIIMKELCKSHPPSVCESHKKFLGRFRPFLQATKALRES
jgi:hypothetical protein